MIYSITMPVSDREAFLEDIGSSFKTNDIKLYILSMLTLSVKFKLWGNSYLERRKRVRTILMKENMV